MPGENVNNEVERLIALGAQNFHAGNDDAAIANFTEAMAHNPTHWGLYENRGTARRRKGDLNGALADYTEALRLNPDNADVYLFRGRVLQQMQQFDQAIADFDKAISLNPMLGRAFEARGILKAQRGDHVAGLADLSQALAMNPNSPFALESRANIYLMQKNFPAALADCNRFIELGTQNPQIRFNGLYLRSQINGSNGNFVACIADLNEVLKMKPDFGKALEQRGTARRESGDFAGALEDYNEAIRLDPNNALAYESRGVAYLQQNQMDKSMADFQTALKINPYAGSAERMRILLKQNGAEVPPEPPHILVKVTRAGELFIDGQPASLDDLSRECAKLAQARGNVQYWRESPEQEPHAIVQQILNTIIGARLPVALLQKDPG